MLDQPELDLPRPAVARSQSHARRPSAFEPVSITLAIAGLMAVAWGMWVTKMLLTPAAEQIVSVRLSSLVGEYVQAEARSGTPPAQVEEEMRSFMAALDRELQRRSARGQVVLVGEAVLSRNVPDITASVRHTVYSSGIAPLRPTSGQSSGGPTASGPPAASLAPDNAVGSPSAGAPVTPAPSRAPGAIYRDAPGH